MNALTNVEFLCTNVNDGEGCTKRVLILWYIKAVLDHPSAVSESEILQPSLEQPPSCNKGAKAANSKIPNGLRRERGGRKRMQPEEVDQ